MKLMSYRVNGQKNRNLKKMMRLREEREREREREREKETDRHADSQTDR